MTEFPTIRDRLSHGPLYRFDDTIPSNVPRVAAGLYTVWDNSRFLYVGMAGQGLTQDRITQLIETAAGARGLCRRLQSHAAGRRSGDQFCLYVCDRYLLESLDASTIRAVASGKLSLDRLTRAFIRDRLAFRFVTTRDGTAALKHERTIRREGLAGRKPELNPLE